MAAHTISICFAPHMFSDMSFPTYLMLSRCGSIPGRTKTSEGDMFKMSIKPQWLVEGLDTVRRPLHQLIDLLTAVDEAGQLAAAAKRRGVSYRYAWELLRGGGRIFGAPLVAMTRGRGAVLTPLAEKLLWANRRIAARLDPTLDSLASELEVEIE